MNNGVPKHVLGNMGLPSSRAFKALKRRQWRAVMKSLREYRLGCAYAAGYELVEDFEDRAAQIQRKLSEKEWGR